MDSKNIPVEIGTPYGITQRYLFCFSFFCCMVVVREQEQGVHLNCCQSYSTFSHLWQEGHWMEHFFCLFLALLQIQCFCFTPSQRLKVFYVLSMLFQFLETHGCISIFLPVSHSCPPFPPLKQTHICTSLHTTSLNASVRFRFWSPQGTSNCPKFVRDVDATGF